MMGNIKSVVQAWRRRQYFYASASVFNSVSCELKEWLKPELEDGELDEPERKKRVKALFKVLDYDKMFSLVGNAIFEFVKQKRAPFPGAVDSKQNFLSIAAWKRGIIYTNLVRHVTEMPANNHWYKFGYKEYKANKKLMERYCVLDEKVLQSSSKFCAIPDEVHLKTPEKAKTRKKRTRESFELSSPEMGNKVRRTVCVLTSSSDEDAEDDDD